MNKDIKRTFDYGMGISFYSIIWRVSTVEDYINKKSTVTIKFIFVPHQYTTLSTHDGTGYYTLNGVKYTFNTGWSNYRTFLMNSETVIGTFTHTFDYNEDGTKSITFGVSAVDGMWSIGNMQISDTIYMGVNDTLKLPDLMARILTADNFTDESNPSITYSVPTEATKVEACISFTGGNDDIPYREISKTGTSYTFQFTEDERNVLRRATIDAQSKTVRFYLKTTAGGTTMFHYVDRTLTIVNSNPILSNPTVRDVNSTTLALTGNENILIKYASMAEYSVNVTVAKEATIANQFVQCGSKKVTGMSYGVIDNPESGLFVFSVTDSRGLNTTATVEKTLLDYLKPTCYQKVTTELVGETGAKAVVTISGNFFNGSFGAIANTLKIEMRHTQNDGTMGDWVDLSPLGYTQDGNTYELVTNITGLDYNQSYTFQSRVTDKLNYVESAQYVVKVKPVFDWDNDDFNFNVPVNIEGELNVNGEINMNANEFKMNNETILRHSTTTNNTVLSGSGNHIYLRPNGTNSTSNETIFYSNGSVDFSGPIMINGVEIGTGGENKVLWSGNNVLASDTTITLSEAISEQNTGVVLLFSYSTDATYYVTYFIPKYVVSAFPGVEHHVNYFTGAFAFVASKDFIVNDTTITGTYWNNRSGTNAATKIPYSNNHMYLKAVIGV